MGVSERMPRADAGARRRADAFEAFDVVFAGERVLVGGAFVAAEVGVRGGRIAAIAPRSGADAARPAGGHRVDLARDEVLIPGLVDTHVHVNEPGRTEWEGFASATRAAAAGGVTTILDMPLNSIPPTVSVDALAVKRAAADGRVFVDVGFWGGLVPGGQGDLLPLHEAGVFGFKCFLVDSGVPEFPPVAADEMERAMAVLADAGSMLIVHAEDAALIAAAPNPHGRDYADFLASRPREAEQAAIRSVIDAARRTGASAHILHLSSGDALPELARRAPRACRSPPRPARTTSCSPPRTSRPARPRPSAARPSARPRTATRSGRVSPTARST
ncbi:hypothetical protein GCM10025870_10150 [Agromyces marinus]|uniref:Amidohydrolase-related domain-containing protein n=1 Tax=Agromyces marinus TaxID=1389020 RepID=A0ABN6YCT7_9MICO|nr:hypothetical protein GCM10025870_10150 [Agromyces marinus]